MNFPDNLFTEDKVINWPNINNIILNWDNIINDNNINDNNINDNNINDNIINDNNINKHKRKKNKIKCIIENCTFTNHKEHLCRIHYNKTYNLLCSIQNCTNIKRKNNLCYKHIKPLCCIIRCKCYALSNEVLCKKHKKFKIELFR